jgi:hypothetical protein
MHFFLLLEVWIIAVCPPYSCGSGPVWLYTAFDTNVCGVLLLVTLSNFSLTAFLWLDSGRKPVPEKSVIPGEKCAF